MKKALLLLGCLLLIINTSAQDLIILRTGEEISGKVTAVKPDHVEYKKISNLDGPLYQLMKYEIYKISYENGRSELYSSYTKPAPASEKTAYQEMVKKKEKKKVVVDNEGFTSINSVFAATYMEFEPEGLHTGPYVNITSINGFQFKPKAFWGIGTGLVFGDLSYSIDVPLFFNMVFDLNEKNFRPFISPSLGAVFCLSRNNYEGSSISPFVGAGFGWKKYFSEKKAFIFSLNVDVHPVDQVFNLNLGLKAGLSF